MPNTYPQPASGNTISRQMIGYELMAFMLVLVVIWFDEFLDIPHFLLKAPPTPVNWQESILESVLILPVILLLIRYTRKLLRRLRRLEGLLPICSACKKIRNEQGDWQMIESYIGQHSDAQFTHGICPQCAHQLYPDIFPDIFPDNDTQKSSVENSELKL